MTITTKAMMTTALAAAAVGLALAPISQADDGCGPASFWNTATNQCELYPVAGPVGPGPVGPGPVGPGPVGPGPVGPGPVGPGPVGPGPIGPGPLGPGR